MENELERQVTGLKQGDHLCLIYQDAAEQMAAIVPFMKARLARGEACLYIGDGYHGGRGQCTRRRHETAVAKEWRKGCRKTRSGPMWLASVHTSNIIYSKRIKCRYLVYASD